MEISEQGEWEKGKAWGFASHFLSLISHIIAPSRGTGASELTLHLHADNR